jgi:hypothetical protein
MSDTLVREQAEAPGGDRPSAILKRAALVCLIIAVLYGDFLLFLVVYRHGLGILNP